MRSTLLEGQDRGRRMKHGAKGKEQGVKDRGQRAEGGIFVSPQRRRERKGKFVRMVLDK